MRASARTSKLITDFTVAEFIFRIDKHRFFVMFFCNEMVLGCNNTVMERNSQRCNLRTITNVFFFGENHHGREMSFFFFATQPATDATTQQQQQAHTIPHHTKHIILSSTDTGPLHSKWHEACTGIPRLSFCMMRAIRQSANGPRPTQSGTQGKSGPCVQREPTGREIIVMVIERRRDDM